MSKLIFAALAISAAAEDAETAAVQAIEGLKTKVSTVEAKNAELETEKGDLKTKLEAANAKLDTITKAGRQAKVDAAVAAGKIAPKDEETKTQALDLLEANEALGDKFLASLPAKHDVTKPIVNAGTQDKPTDKADKLEGHQLLEAALAEDIKG